MMVKFILIKVLNNYYVFSVGAESGLVDAWFEGQKKLYVGAGKAFGDLVSIVTSMLVVINMMMINMMMIMMMMNILLSSFL